MAFEAQDAHKVHVSHNDLVGYFDGNDCLI